MNNFSWKWIAAGVFVLGLGAWFWLSGGKEERFTVRAVPLHATLMVPGKIESASQEIKLSFDQPGTIRAVHVKEGDVVAAGDVLAELAHDDLTAKVEIAKWELEEAKARRDKAVKGPRQEDIDEARAYVKHYESEKMYQQSKLQRREKITNAVSKDEMDMARMQYDQAAEKLAACEANLKKLLAGSRPEEIAEAEAAVHEMEGKLAAAQANLGKALLKAPIAGRAIRVLSRAGEGVTTAGDPVPVAILADTENLRVRAEVDESHIHEVRPGQKAWVSAEALSGQKFPATVLRLLDVMGRKKVESDDPRAKADTRVLEVILSVEKNENLKLGLRVDVQIEIAENPAALMIPRAFVAYAEGSPAVLVRTGGKPVPTPVVLGVDHGAMVEVKSGIKDGDVLVRKAS